MALRILIDGRHLKDFGVGTYIRNLTRALAEIDREDHFIVFLRPEDATELSGLPSNFVIVTCVIPESLVRESLRFPLFARRHSPDVCHIPLNRVPFLTPRPYVVTVHDLAEFLFPRRSGWRQKLLEYQIRHGLLRAAKVIAVSSATRRDVMRVIGVPPERIRLIYNAPDPRFLKPPNSDGHAGQAGAAERFRRRILERYQISYPFVLYVGNIRPQKNVPRLIEAFAVLRSKLTDHPRYKDLRLIVIGDEIGRYPAVRQAVVRSRVEDAVRFLGFVPIDTLRVFYEAASVFAFPSLYEGFGLPPLEAMAAGTPVVTSNVSALPEVVGDAAVIVNPENVFDIERGLRDALLDEELRNELIEKSRAQLRRFNWRKTAREVIETYHEVARGGSGR